MARLTIPDEPTQITYTVTTANSVFPFPFAVFDKSDLRLLKDGVALPQSSFTMSGTILDGGGYQGGTVTLNSAIENCEFRISRKVRPVRTSNFAPANSIPVRSIDMALNRLTAQQQDVEQQVRDVEAGLLDPDIVQEAVDQAAAGLIGSLARRDASNLTPSNVAAWNAKLGSASGSLGYWNATTNSPVITSGVGVEGAYYTVIVAGTTEIDGVDEWAVGDRIIFTNGAWLKSSGVTTSTLFTTLEEHGGKANDASFDNAPAFAAAEAYLTAKMAAETGFKGVLQLRGGVDYYFKDTLLMKRRGGAWVGERTRLIYNGASTTKDLVVFGHYNGGESLTGKPQTRDVHVSGLQILSATNMTAGCAVRTRSCIESTFEFELQTQTGYEALGNNLYNGLWSEWSSTCVYEGITYVAKNKAILINGAPGLSGGKSDCWFDIGKIGGAQIGMHIGGGFGGIWCQGRTTFISNKKHVLIDQGLTAENNREVMFKGATFDYTAVNNGADPGDVGIDVADASEVFIDITDCWIAGAHGAHLIVRAASSAFINCSGNRWFFGKPHPTDATLTGHAVVVDSNTSRVFIQGGQMNAFPGVAIKPRAADHYVNYSGVSPWNCPNGLFDATLANNADTTYRVQDGATLVRSAIFSSNAIVGAAGTNTAFRMQFDDPTYPVAINEPMVQFDLQDKIKFYRSANIMALVIAGVEVMRLRNGGVQIMSGDYVAHKRISGTADGSGAFSAPHGISSLTNRVLSLTAVEQHAGGDWHSISVGCDGSNVGVTGSASGRPIRVYVTYSLDAL